jgi:WD40 repeat protein
VAAWQAVVATLERNTARSRELAAQSQLQLTDAEAFPRLAALLALESQRIEENPVANQSLQTSLTRLPPPHVGAIALGQRRKIAQAVFSPDSRILAAVTEGQFAGEPTKLELWEATGGRQLAAWEAKTRHAVLSFSDDGRHLVFADDDNTATIVAVDSRQVVRQMSALSGSWARAGGALRVLAPGETPNVLRIVDAIADRELATITARAAIMQATMSADGSRVATTTADGQLAVWRIADGAATAAWQIATRADWPVFSVDGKKLAAVVDDKAAAVFDVESSKTLERMAGLNKVIGAKFSPAAHYVLVAEDPGRIRVFDLMLHKPIMVVGGRTNEFAVNDMIDVTQRSPITDVAFAGDDRFFVAVRSDGVVMQFRRGATLGAGTFGVNFLDHAETMRVSVGQNLKQAVLSPDGRYLITTSGGNAMNAAGTMDLADYKTRVWSLADGREVARITSDRGVGVAAVSPDSRLVSTQNMTGVMDEQENKAVPSLEMHAWRLMDTIGGDATVAPAPDDEAVKRLVQGILSLDGRFVAAISDAGLVLWDATHGLRTIALPEPAPAQEGERRPSVQRALRFSDDGELLLAVVGGSALAFRTGNGGLIGRKDFEGVIGGIALDRAGRTAAATAYRPDMVKTEQMFGGIVPRGAMMTHVWKIADGADVGTIEHTTPVNVVALSRDGSVAAMVTSPYNRDDIELVSKGVRFSVPLRASIELWDVGRGRPLRPPLQGDSMIGFATFSDDGNALMSLDLPAVWALRGPIGTGPGSFAIWDVRSGRRIATPHLVAPKSTPGPAPGEGPFRAVYGLSADGHSVLVTEHVIRDATTARITTRQILWQTADLVRLVCERLPAGQRTLTAEEVGRLVPGGGYRPTCPPS